MAAVTIATVGKKALEILASNKKGRKFLGYVIGIAIFVLLIPVITLVGLFGWMVGDGSETVVIDQNVRQGIGDHYSEYSEQLAEIESTFTACGLTEQDVKKAGFIFVSLLTERSEDEGFYENYAKCFTDTSGKHSVYALISATFGVTFTEDEMNRLDQFYGETPIREVT